MRLKTLLSSWVYPLCHAPSIDGADGKKHADCLSPLQGGRVSAGSGRFGDAQDTRGTGRVLLVRFLARTRK